LNWILLLLAVLSSLDANFSNLSNHCWASFLLSSNSINPYVGAVIKDDDTRLGVDMSSTVKAMRWELSFFCYIYSINSAFREFSGPSIATNILEKFFMDLTYSKLYNNSWYINVYNYKIVPQLGN
jgi:hypothetical protein